MAKKIDKDDKDYKTLEKKQGNFQQGTVSNYGPMNITQCNYCQWMGHTCKICRTWLANKGLQNQAIVSAAYAAPPPQNNPPIQQTTPIPNQKYTGQGQNNWRGESR